MANEYIFAIGAHVLYWGSKDLASFIVHHVGRDVLPEEEEAWRAMMHANSLLPTGTAATTAAAGAAAAAAANPEQQQSAQPSRRGSSALSASASASSSLAAAVGEREKDKGASVEIPEAVKISMAS